MLVFSSHPKHAVLPVLHRPVKRHRDGLGEHAPGAPGVDDAVVVGACARVEGRVLARDAGGDGRLDPRHLLLSHRWLPFPHQLVVLHDAHHSGCLLAAHYGDLSVRPQEGESGVEGRAAHGVVARSEAAAADDGELRHRDVADGVDHLGPVLGDAPLLVGGPDDEAGDVVQKNQRGPALAADLHEVRGLDCGLAEDHAVVREDAHGVALNVRPSADHGAAVLGLELVKARPIDNTCDHLADVVRDAGGLGDDPQQALLVVKWRLRGNPALQLLAGRSA
mmetsp:Transcript_88987/g.254772  ORF Transcript_88987/g.254772 Transcript_88987/m.254772 type:complete len:278 (-) Transcript_88987:2246-3079(-)